jgi:hypothetical protein
VEVREGDRRIAAIEVRLVRGTWRPSTPLAETIGQCVLYRAGGAYPLVFGLIVHFGAYPDRGGATVPILNALEAKGDRARATPCGRRAVGSLRCKRAVRRGGHGARGRKRRGIVFMDGAQHATTGHRSSARAE